MADYRDLEQEADDAGRRRQGKLSKKAMSRLDDEVIDRMLLQPDRRRRKPWWRKLLGLLTKQWGSTDG